MNKIKTIGIISFAIGLMFVSADAVSAQNRREARRELRDEIRDARKDYRDDIRNGRNPRAARREMREDVRDARQDYRREVRRGNGGWYLYNNNRRVGFYPFSSWFYRNGQFIRRY